MYKKKVQEGKLFPWTDPQFLKFQTLKFQIMTVPHSLHKWGVYLSTIVQLYTVAVGMYYST